MIGTLPVTSTRDKELSLTDVQWVMGHAHLSTTEIYLTPTRDEVIEGVLAHHARQSRVQEAPPPQRRRAMTRSRCQCCSGGRHDSHREATMARNNPGARRPAAPAQPRNSQLRRQFPPRPGQERWPATAQGEDEVLRRLALPPFLAEMKATQAGRRRGTAKLLRWLSSFPGDTWQQGWEASRAEDHPGSSWARLPLRWLQDNGWDHPPTITTCRPGC